MQLFFTIMMMVAIIVIPVIAIILLITLIRRKPHKTLLIILAAASGAFIVSLFGSILSHPGTFCKHEWKLVAESAATCNGNGEKVYHCALCDTNKKEEIPKLDHEYVETATKNEDCTHDGEKTFTCKLCGDSYTETVAALGHDMVEIQNVNATETKDGKTVKRCSRCGYEEITIIDKLEVSADQSSTESSQSSKKDESSSGSKEDSATLKDVDTSVKYDEIYRAYEKNELTADEKYKNKRYLVTAAVYSINSNDLFGAQTGATLILTTTVGSDWVMISAQFKKSQLDELKKLSKDDTITFVGTCYSAMFWHDCELITE